MAARRASATPARSRMRSPTRSRTTSWSPSPCCRATATSREVFEGTREWKAIEVDVGSVYRWNGGSTYVQNPPYFEGITMTPPEVTDIVGARILALFGDNITTDHISPAGNIRASAPAGEYLG